MTDHREAWTRLRSWLAYHRGATIAADTVLTQMDRLDRDDTAPVDVVDLTRHQVAELAATLTAAADRSEPARLMIQDGGVKVSINRRSWTLQLGTTQDPT